MREHATTLLPVAGFVVMAALAIVDVGVASSRATSQVHALARQYAEALSDGDLAAAAAFHSAADPGALSHETDSRRGDDWWITAVREESDGSVVTVLEWADGPAGGRSGSAEMTLAWRRGADGWRIAP